MNIFFRTGALQKPFQALHTARSLYSTETPVYLYEVQFTTPYPWSETKTTHQVVYIPGIKQAISMDMPSAGSFFMTKEGVELSETTPPPLKKECIGGHPIIMTEKTIRLLETAPVPSALVNRIQSSYNQKKSLETTIERLDKLSQQIVGSYNKDCLELRQKFKTPLLDLPILPQNSGGKEPSRVVEGIQSQPSGSRTIMDHYDGLD